MPADSPIPLMGEDYFAWRMRYPDAADELIQIVNRMYGMRWQLVRPGGNTAGANSVLLDSAQSMILAAPLQFAAPIASPTGGSVVDVECRAALTAIMAQLRLTNQLPS
jgi:hypothetical protein